MRKQYDFKEAIRGKYFGRIMENPQGWNRATNIIYEAVRDHEQGAEQEVVGSSLYHLVACRLEQAGFLTERAKEVVGMTDDPQASPR
jgi:hypothetical protein